MGSQIDTRRAGDRTPADGIDQLVGTFAYLAGRRLRGSRPVPIVLLRGAGGPHLVEDLRGRLVDARRPTVPHAWVDGRGDRTAPPPPAPAGRPDEQDGDRTDVAPDETAQDLAVLDAISRALTTTMPTPMGRLRPWRYQTLRSVLGVQVGLGEQPDQRRDLRDQVYALDQQQPRHRAARVLTTFVRWFPAIGQWLTDEPIVSLDRFLVGRRLTRDPALQWVSEQVSDGTEDDFLVAAVAFAANGPERHDPEAVRRALVLCLLSDLAAALRWGRLSRQRRRRTTPFVLLFPAVAADGATHRFLGTLGPAQADLQASTRRRLRWLRRPTTFVLAALEPGTGIPAPLLPPEHDGDGDDGLCSPPDRAVGAIRALIAGGPGSHEPPAPAICVDVPAPPAGAGAGPDAGARVRPLQPRLPRLVPFAAWTGIALGGVLASTLIVDAGAQGWDAVFGSSSCPGIHEAEGTGELIGLGDGTAECTFAEAPEGLDEGLRTLQEDQRAVEAEIAAENARVLQRAEQGQPYGTVVFFAPLTVPDIPERRGQSAVRQLRGIALAQAEANRQAANNRDKPQIRVLLANPGDRFAHGPAVARQIQGLAGEDESIVGVIGIGQSRARSRRAIEILAEAQLPVVAGPVTGDDMVRSSPYYYQVTPRNRRIAAVLAAFAHDPPARDRAVPVVAAREAVVVMDPGDQYSRTLAEDFVQAFDDADHDVIDTLAYEAQAPARTPLSQLAHDVCQQVGDPGRAIVFFASRSQQLGGLLDDLQTEGCADGLTIVAGPELTKFVQDPGIDLGDYRQFRLYYAAFASSALPDGSATERFVGDYRAAYGGDDIAVDISDPAAAYDALYAMWTATNLAAEDRLTLTRETVAGQLANGQVAFAGASGYVTFHGGHHTDRVPPDKLVLVLEALPRPSAEPVVHCGQMSSRDDPSTHQSGLCPDVN